MGVAYHDEPGLILLLKLQFMGLVQKLCHCEEA